MFRKKERSRRREKYAGCGLRKGGVRQLEKERKRRAFYLFKKLNSSGK